MWHGWFSPLPPSLFSLSPSDKMTAISRERGGFLPHYISSQVSGNTLICSIGNLSFQSISYVFKTGLGFMCAFTIYEIVCHFLRGLISWPTPTRFGKIFPKVGCLFVTITSLLGDMSTGGELNWKWGISTPSACDCPAVTLGNNLLPCCDRRYWDVTKLLHEMMRWNYWLVG